jgi:small-conductance mechanosensitive channel
VHIALAAVRFVVLLIAIGIVTRLVPGSLGPVLSWALLAAAAALGWSARDILPDVLASAVLIFERRVRPGVWITAAGHSGIVEARGLRAVWIRDSLGHRIAIPNRLFLSGAVISQPGGAFHDVNLRFAVPGIPAARLRRALLDAVLASPWVQPDADGVVRRDGSDPSMWHVRARLIDVRFAVSFEDELLERAEEMLAAEGARVAGEDWD